MEFDWDVEKSRRNAAKRGLPFSLATALFQERTLETVDDRQDYGEVRIQVHGTIRDRVFVCVYTDRVTDGRSVRRIISLRKASAREVKRYHEWIKSEESG